MNSSQNLGFTLIEIVVALAIIMTLLGSTIFISMDFYRAYSFRYEENLLLTLFTKSRNRAMANIDNASHGLCIREPNYIIFEGTDCDSANVVESVPKNNSFIITDMPQSGIVFEKLSGNCVSCGSSTEIILSEGTKSAKISVNSEGRIDW